MMKKKLIKGLLIALAAVVGGILGLVIVLAIVLPGAPKQKITANRPTISVKLYTPQPTQSPIDIP